MHYCHRPVSRMLICAFLLMTGWYSRAQSFVDTALLGHNAKAGHYLATRGIRLYYEVYGAGQPLLLVHGNGGSISDFKYQVPYFARRYKVIIADSRAQGRSVDTGDSLSYEMMADDLAALLDHLKTDSCNVIGWSDGGINGLLLALRYPRKVKKLAVTGANLWPDTTALDPWLYQAMVNEYNRLQQAPASPSPKVKNDRKLLWLMVSQPHITLESLQKISCPTLVIGGDHDVIRPLHTLQIAEAIPRSYLWILPHSGHSTLIHYRDEFNKKVQQFLENPYQPIEQAGRFE